VAVGYLGPPGLWEFVSEIGENSMLGEARGYAAAIAIQHLLRTLEAKGIMEPTETAAMLDGVLDELACLGRDGVMSPEETASARKTIGVLYLPIRKEGSQTAVSE
jgi:hypothetical protein